MGGTPWDGLLDLESFQRCQARIIDQWFISECDSSAKVLHHSMEATKVGQAIGSSQPSFGNSLGDESQGESPSSPPLAASEPAVQAPPQPRPPLTAEVMECEMKTAITKAGGAESYLAFVSSFGHLATEKDRAPAVLDL